MTTTASSATPEPRRYAIVGTGHRAEMYVAALRDTHADVGVLVALCDVITEKPLTVDVPG